VAAVAQGREDFNIIVPFNAPYSYLGTAPLHMWIQVQSAMAPVLIVDGTDDGPGQPVESHTATYNSSSGVYTVTFLRGQAPVIGLIADSTPVARELRLVAHGEPWSASSAGPVCNFDVHVCSGLSVGTPCFLFMGTWSDTPVVTPPCSSWLASPGVIGTGNTDAYGMLGFPVPIPQGLVHSEFGLQAALFPVSGGMLLSNALRVHVGGGL
jgi:hypothetical protein